MSETDKQEPAPEAPKVTAPTVPSAPKPRAKRKSTPKPAQKKEPESDLLARLISEREEVRKVEVKEAEERNANTLYVVECPSHACKGPAYVVKGWPMAPPYGQHGMPHPRRFLDSGLGDEDDYEVRMNGLCVACFKREGVHRQVAPTDRLIRPLDIRKVS